MNNHRKDGVTCERLSSSCTGDDGMDSPQQHLLSPTSIQSAGSFSIRIDSLVKQAPLHARVKSEVVRLTKLSVPLFIQNLLSYSTTVVAVAFVGHLDKPELLSSAVLANSLYNVTGYSLLSGLASGMESLCGQAFGARSYKTLGLVLQRALLINWTICIPITLLWTFSEQMLLALGQQPGIAAGASMYLRLITPTLYTGAVVECLKRYLLAQRVVVPGMVVTVITCLLSPLYNWLFIFRLHLGLAGAAMAFTCSQATTALLLVMYMAWRDMRMAAQQHAQATWCRPGRAMFAGWGTYLSYGLPATVQLCTEWWMYEVVIFMAGMSHNAEIGQGVMGLLFQISACAYMSALAYGSSVNTRVGNELGAGNASAARLSVYTCVVVVAAVQCVLVLACKLAERGVVRLLTNNKEVEDLTVATMPVLLPTFVFDALNCVAQGVLRGAGRPGLGAMLNSAGYWGLGVPLAAYFGLYLGWSVKGFWLALMTTSTIMAVVQLAAIGRFDWNKEVQRSARLMAEHDDQAAASKSEHLDAAVSGRNNDCDVFAAAAAQQHLQDGVSDVEPLLPAQHWSSNATQPKRASEQGLAQAVRSQGFDHPPSRLSWVRQPGQTEERDETSASSSGGQFARLWMQWPLNASSRDQQPASSLGQAGASPLLRSTLQRGSLTRGLLGPAPSEELENGADRPQSK